MNAATLEAALVKEGIAIMGSHEDGDEEILILDNGLEVVSRPWLGNKFWLQQWDVKETRPQIRAAVKTLPELVERVKFFLKVERPR